jgi:hypothetical protein
MINIRLIKLIKRDIKVKNSCLGENFKFVTLDHRADRIESTPTTPLMFPFFFKAATQSFGPPLTCVP